MRPTLIGDAVAAGPPDLLLIVVQAFWLMLPAMAAGPAAVFGGRGSRPIDGGLKLRDGRPVFGKGKTVAGFLWGLLVGTGTGTLQSIIVGTLAIGWLTGFRPVHESALGTFGVVFPIALGAMCGDLLGAFLKRRLGYPRGASAPVLDQLDFAIGAWAFLLVFSPDFFFATFTVPHLLVIAIMVPLLHRMTNIIGHRWGKKREPW